MAIDVLTLGCRLNACESEIIGRKALAAGLTDTVVVNTCAVTAEAVRQSRQTIRRIKRARPHARTRGAPYPRPRTPRACLRPGAKWVRPPLHLLHHSIRPWKFTFAPHERGSDAGAQAMRARLPGSGSDRGRSHRLWLEAPWRARARHARAANPQARAGAAPAAPFLHRFC